MKRILVTGGFGFLGSHLVERLLACDHGAEVVVVDNLASSAVVPHPFTVQQDTAGEGPPGRLSYRLLPLRDWLARSQRTDGPFSEVYHLASVVGPVGVLGHAGQIAPSVVGDAAALAEACVKWGARLVDVSTSEVYGGGVDGMCREDMACRVDLTQTSARLEYAAGKLAAEVMLRNTAGLDVVVVRPFNIAGPRQGVAGGFVLPRFIAQARAGEALTVYGDGSQVRAFTHVKEVAQGLHLAMRRGTSGEVYNLGNAANRITILELAQRVMTATGASAVTWVDPRDLHGSGFAEASDKYPDETKSRAELGWDPQRDVDDIIADVLA